MKRWLAESGALLLALVIAVFGLWTVFVYEPPAPAGRVVTVREPVLWVQDPDGGWHCEPWKTFAEASEVCDIDQLPPEAYGPIDDLEGVPVG